MLSPFIFSKHHSLYTRFDSTHLLQNSCILLQTADDTKYTAKCYNSMVEFYLEAYSDWNHVCKLFR